MHGRWYGVDALIVTPFVEDGQLDEAALGKHTRFLLDDGAVHGMIPTSGIRVPASPSIQSAMVFLTPASTHARSSQVPEHSGQPARVIPRTHRPKVGRRLADGIAPDDRDGDGSAKIELGSLAQDSHVQTKH